jgi:hypothetical protein
MGRSRTRRAGGALPAIVVVMASLAAPGAAVADDGGTWTP